MLAIAHPAIVFAAPTAGIPDYGSAVGTGTTFAESGSPATPVLGVNVSQQNSVINWNGAGFNVGNNGAVNFNSSVGPASILNYDNSGAMSTIQGAVNNNGNKIFLVNPKGISDSSGAFSGLIANDAANVTLDNTGKLNIISTGNALVDYGTVTGNANKSFDLNVELSKGSGTRDGKMVLGGNTTTIDVVKEAGGISLNSDDVTLQGTKTIINSKEGLGDIEFIGLTGSNIQINNFQNTAFTGDLNTQNVEIKAAGLDSQMTIKNATGAMDNLKLNNGVLKIDSNVAGGVLTFNNLNQKAYVGGTHIDVSNGSTVNFNAPDIVFNSDKDIRSYTNLTTNEMINAGATNSFTATAKGTGGNININGGNIYAEQSIRFVHDAGAGGSLNLSHVYLLSREADVELVKNTEFTATQDGGVKTVEIRSDQKLNDQTGKGLIIIDDAGVKSSVTVSEGKVYTNAQKNDTTNDWWLWSSDNRVVIDWDKTHLDYVDAKEGEALFDSMAANIPNPNGDGAGGDGDGGGDGGAVTPTDPITPTVPIVPATPTTPSDDWPADPSTGLPIDPNTGWPSDPITGWPIDPNTGLPTDPSAIPPGSGDPWEIDPGTGWPINPGTGLPVDPDTMPGGSTPGDGDGAETPTTPDTGSGTTDPSNSGNPVDPATGLPLDPQTGLPTYPDTTLPADPQTGIPTIPGSGVPTDPDAMGDLPGRPGAGSGTPGTPAIPYNPGDRPTDPQTGWPVDTETGWPIDPETSLPTDPATISPGTGNGSSNSDGVDSTDQPVVKGGVFGWMNDIFNDEEEKRKRKKKAQEEARAAKAKLEAALRAKQGHIEFL